MINKSGWVTWKFIFFSFSFHFQFCFTFSFNASPHIHTLKCVFRTLSLHTDPQSRKWMNINTHCILYQMGQSLHQFLLLFAATLLLLYCCVKNETVASSIKVTNWFFNELFLIVIVQLHFFIYFLLPQKHTHCSRAAAILSTSIQIFFCVSHTFIYFLFQISFKMC